MKSAAYLMNNPVQQELDFFNKHSGDDVTYAVKSICRCSSGTKEFPLGNTADHACAVNASL